MVERQTLALVVAIQTVQSENRGRVHQEIELQQKQGGKMTQRSESVDGDNFQGEVSNESNVKFFSLHL